MKSHCAHVTCVVQKAESHEKALGSSMAREVAWVYVTLAGMLALVSGQAWAMQALVNGDQNHYGGGHKARRSMSDML